MVQSAGYQGGTVCRLSRWYSLLAIKVVQSAGYQGGIVCGLSRWYSLRAIKVVQSAGYQGGIRLGNHSLCLYACPVMLFSGPLFRRVCMRAS